MSADMQEIQTIGILGAGKVGTAIGRQALKAGYKVLIATGKSPEEIALIVEITVRGAKPVTSEVAVRDSDLVILAIPLPKYHMLDPAVLRGKLVVDVMNYWPPTDGVIDDFQGGRSSSEIVQDHLPGARLVRTLNHIGYHDLEDDARPVGHPERRALAVAGDDPEARVQVTRFIERLGFDAVDAGPLKNSRYIAQGTEIFARAHQRPAMEQRLAEAHTGGSDPLHQCNRNNSVR